MPPSTLLVSGVDDESADLIWQMWTEPEHFKAWYGPDGAAIPVARMDVRIGGTRLVCIQISTLSGPMQMWFTGEYREVVSNQRLVYTESVSDENGNVLSRSDMGMPPGHPATTTVAVELQHPGEGRHTQARSPRSVGCAYQLTSRSRST